MQNTTNSLSCKLNFSLTILERKLFMPALFDKLKFSGPLLNLTQRASPHVTHLFKERSPSLAHEVGEGGPPQRWVRGPFATTLEREDHEQPHLHKMPTNNPTFEKSECNNVPN